MPAVPVEIRNFPVGSPVRNGFATLNLTWPKLVWAAISVGKGSLAHIHQHGQYSTFEILYRAAIIYANLTEGHNTQIDRSEAYDGLDPSEKGAISYFLGLALTKAFVDEFLGVPWLMHVDVYRRQLGVNLAAVGGRPDLFGEDLSGRWVVAESKGRTNDHDDGALVRAKQQASQVIDIGGVPPYLSIGVVSSFSGGRLSLVVDDPPVDEKSSQRWGISKELFRSKYYEPFNSVLNAFEAHDEVIDGQEVRAVTFEDSDLTVGLSLHMLDRGNDLPLRRARSDPSRSAFLGVDGVFIRLGSSWSDEMMRLEPQSRVRR